MFFEIVVVGHGHFNGYVGSFIATFEVERLRNQRCAVAALVKHFYKLHNTAFAVESSAVCIALLIQFA